MYIFHLFRSFLPLHNPIGFGAGDFVELVLVLLLVCFALFWPWVAPYAQAFARRTVWCMLLLAALPVALRLFLLPGNPVPTPAVSDDFSYLLLADTLRHFRLANPSHPLHQFFETFFVLQEPTYSSIFPLGQGIALALGWTLFGHPWAGVALPIAAFCALCYWMLKAWTTPGWALAGGLLAVIQFGPLNQWMNSYWGGGVSATAGCLVFGALPRLRASGRTRDGILLGLGLAIQLLTRPYECVLLVWCVIPFFLTGWRKLFRVGLLASLTVVPAVALTLFENKQVTGEWLTLPYMLSRYQYGVPATFTFQPNPVPHRQLTPEQQLDYDIQSAVHGKGVDTIGTYLQRYVSRIRFYRFFFLAPLYLALVAFLSTLRELRFIWVVVTLAVFSLGTNFYPYFYSHYIAVVTCLFVLVSVLGLKRLGFQGARLLLFLCAAHFLFWYGLHLLNDEKVSLAMWQYETWDAINSGDPQGRIAINAQLRHAAGKQLVFVRYWPQHQLEEWVHNAADIDHAPIVWARDLGPEENAKLRSYYPDRTVWLLQPDARPVQLTPYPLAR